MIYSLSLERFQILDQLGLFPIGEPELEVAVVVRENVLQGGGAVRYLRVGERSAWNESTSISAGVCRLCPGSVKSGATWQLAHCAFSLKSVFPRAAAALSKLPSGAFGAGMAI
jgi:hypothetical protein